MPKKRLSALLLVCCLILCLFPAEALASTKIDIIGQDLRDKFTENHTNTMDVFNREADNSRWTKNASTNVLVKVGGNPVQKSDPTFSDVPRDHWAFDYIEKAAADGAVNGIGGGLFAPTSPLTMAHLIVILTRAFYGDELALRTENMDWKETEGWRYRDLNAWYVASEKVANDHALFAYTDRGAYALPDPLTRYNMASIIYNLLTDHGIFISEESLRDILPAISDLDSFADTDYYWTVPVVYALGILQGYDASGTFRGDATMSRAQAAAVYCRIQSVFASLGSIAAPTPTPIPVVTLEPTPTPILIATPEPTATPIPTATPEPTATPIPTATPEPTATPIPTATPEPTATPIPTATPEPTATPIPDNNSFPEEVLRLVNEARAEEGISPMTLDETLCEAADVRARELTELFSHTRPDGSDCFSILSEYPIRYFAAGENIAAGQSTPESVMDSWMNSPGHRANILNPSYDSLGVGYASVSSGYRSYWCQLFTG